MKHIDEAILREFARVRVTPRRNFAREHEQAKRRDAARFRIISRAYN